MTVFIVKQSDEDNFVSLPQAVTQALGLSVGSELEACIVENKLVLTPVNKEATLEELLEASPKESFVVQEEDQKWLNMPPVGREL